MSTISLTSTAAAVSTAVAATPQVGGAGSTYITSTFKVSINTNGVKQLLAGGGAITYPLTRDQARELALATLRLTG